MVVVPELKIVSLERVLKCPCCGALLVSTVGIPFTDAQPKQVEGPQTFVAVGTESSYGETSKKTRKYKHREGWKQSTDMRGKWKRHPKMKQGIDAVPRRKYGMKPNRVFGEANSGKCPYCPKEFTRGDVVASLKVHVGMMHKNEAHKRVPAYDDDNEEVEGRSKTFREEMVEEAT